MFSKTHILKIGALVAAGVIISALAVSAAVECHFTSISTQASSASFGLGGQVRDTATIVLSDPGRLKGKFYFYVCGPTAGIQPCISTSLNRTGLAAVSVDVTTTKTPQTITVYSPYFTPTATGTYCFTLDRFTAETGNVFTTPTGTFPHIGGKTSPNTTMECFTVTPLFSIGNLVFRDTNQDGDKDTGETGIANVTMQLLKYPSASCVGDPTTTATTTDTNGYYRFDFTQTGTKYYKVQVAASNFNSGGALFGHLNSSGAFSGYTPAPPTGDSRDRGVDIPVSGAYQSGCITISEGGEPTGETNFGTGDSAAAPNANSDLTQDFGFWSSPTAVTLSSFHAQTDDGNAPWTSWISAVGLIVAGFGAFLFARR